MSGIQNQTDKCGHFLCLGEQMYFCFCPFSFLQFAGDSSIRLGGRFRGRLGRVGLGAHPEHPSCTCNCASQVSAPPGALDCWVFLSCLEVLQRMEGCCDRAQIDSNVAHTVGLWSYATEKVLALQCRCVCCRGLDPWAADGGSCLEKHCSHSHCNGGSGSFRMGQQQPCRNGFSPSITLFNRDK